MLKILFTGGGTGGHIYPILAVLEELKKIIEERKISAEFYYVGAPARFKSLLSAQGIFVSKIFSAKLRRYFDALNFLDFFIFPISVCQALWKVFWIMPDVLFSKGGPGSLPVVLACWFFRVPIIIHDSDSMVGLANKLAFPFARRIAISFSTAFEDIMNSKKGAKQKEALQKKIALVGNPVRRSLIVENLDKAAAKKSFGFVENLPLVLVVAGSQGSIKINDFMISIAAELVKNFQVLHQIGIDNFESAESELNFVLKNFGIAEKSRYKIAPYFEDNLASVYAAADLIVSRASSGAIFETAAVGLPAILVPLRGEVAGWHQLRNAYEYAKAGAAIVLEEDNLKLNLFLSELNKIFEDSEKTKLMAEAGKRFSKIDAGRIIAEEILELCD